MIKLALCFAFTLSGTAYAGGYGCQFGFECYETEECLETNYELDLAFNGEISGQGATSLKATASDVAATYEGHLSSLGGRTVFRTGAGLNHGIDRDLWISRDGQARYLIVDTDELTVVVYHGTCEAKN